MYDFEYLIKKISDAQFLLSPFKHIYLEDFFTLKHFLIFHYPHPAMTTRYGRGFACSAAHVSRSVMVSSW